MKRIVALLLAFIMSAMLLPSVGAQNSWNMEYFYKEYPDEHFNLTKDPNRIMTIEEFIAINHAYSYYGSGATPVTVVDKNGRKPSDWCAKYVQAEANKKVFDADKISWTDPVTLAFAAQFMARSKGKYSYDSNNIYSFSGTKSLTADDILYLSVAVDHGLIPYTTSMNATQTIRRGDARKYEIPSNAVSAVAMKEGSAHTMRECNAYFIDCYWDFDAANKQFQNLKSNSEHITTVTFQSNYINGSNKTSGNRFLGCNIEHIDALPANPSYKRDPQLDAIEYCKNNGIAALLGISNASDNSFSGQAVAELLSSSLDMQIAVSEIVAAVKKYNLDGVNLGIEITDPAYAYLRNSYSSFVSLLAKALHDNGKILLASVGAYFTEAQEENSIYDYPSIGQSSDFVHIILYDDFNDTGFTARGTHGPMSNLTRMGRCLRYAATKISKSKILEGLGAYAVDFNLTWWKAEDISYEKASSLQSQYGAKAVYDNSNNAAGAYFEYTDSSSCLHRVYMETADTVAKRVSLVKNYGLGGFSVYNLSDNNKMMFGEIMKISSFKPEVIVAMRKKLSPISIRGSYDKSILRHEFCSIVVSFIESRSGMSAESFLASKGKAINQSAFTDTTSRDVLIANALGIVGGYGDGRFGPNKTITRQEAAAMLMRLAKVMGMEKPNSSAQTFVENSSLQTWAKEGIDFVSACADITSGKRVMGGTGNNKFSPTGTYTREQSYMSAVRLFNAIR